MAADGSIQALGSCLDVTCSTTRRSTSAAS
ncbi:hypothetical protein [Streptomyces sp. NPDC005167]